MVDTRRRVAEYRERMRARGLRPIQLWVPDTRSPEFAVHAHDQSAAVASASDADDQAFVDALSASWEDAAGDEGAG